MNCEFCEFCEFCLLFHFNYILLQWNSGHEHMDKMKTTHKGWWKQLRSYMRTHTSLTIIISAVILLEVMMGVMFVSAQNFIQRTMVQMVEAEMSATYLSIRNKLAFVEVSIDNLSRVVSESLDEPEWMFELSQQMVQSNSLFWGCGVAYAPNYYPQYGKFFMPYAVRRGQDSIISMQGAASGIDYTKKEYYRVPHAQGKSHWSDRYEDKFGAKAVITTYGAPVHDADNRFVGVALADITIDLLDEVINEEKTYRSTQRLLVTGNFHVLAGKETPVLKEVLDVLKADKGKDAYFTLTTEDGVKRHVFYTEVGGKTDWVLINVLDDSEVFGKLRRQRVLLLIPSIIGLLIAGFIVWRSSRNLKRLHEANAEKERIGGELHVASKIQQNMLPRQDFRNDEVDIQGALTPAREVGGDLYDYYIRDEKLLFCIGDVSGKGAPAAMIMAVIHSLFRAFSAHENNPARIMQTINEAACRNNEANYLVTMFIGVLDLPTGNLRYCDAGHDSPFVMENGKVRIEKCNPHLPLGVFADTKYEIQEMVLAYDSTVFLYTDGLTEARKGPKQFFGIERVETVLGKCADGQLAPRQMLDRITEEVHLYVGGAEQSDDLTMLAIHYTPQQYESKLTEVLSIKNDIHEVSRLNAFQKSFYEKLNLEKSLSRRLQLSVEETVVNVIEYAYPLGMRGDITVKMMWNGKSLKIVVVDAGVMFDPTLVETPDTSLMAEERRVGGLGIHLVRKLMDSVNYEREDGKNILTLVKTI